MKSQDEMGGSSEVVEEGPCVGLAQFYDDIVSPVLLKCTGKVNSTPSGKEMVHLCLDFLRKMNLRANDVKFFKIQFKEGAKPSRAIRFSKKGWDELEEYLASLDKDFAAQTIQQHWRKRKLYAFVNKVTNSTSTEEGRKTLSEKISSTYAATSSARAPKPAPVDTNSKINSLRKPITPLSKPVNVNETSLSTATKEKQDKSTNSFSDARLGVSDTRKRLDSQNHNFQEPLQKSHKSNSSMSSNTSQETRNAIDHGITNKSVFLRGGHHFNHHLRKLTSLYLETLDALEANGNEKSMILLDAINNYHLIKEEEIKIPNIIPARLTFLRALHSKDTLRASKFTELLYMRNPKNDRQNNSHSNSQDIAQAKKKMADVYNKSSDTVLSWICAVLEIEKPEEKPRKPDSTPVKSDLVNLLREGTYLCELVSKVNPKIKCSLITQGLAFCIHRIFFYLEACREAGVQRKHIFTAVDVFIPLDIDVDRKHRFRVMRTLFIYSRQIRANGYAGPWIDFHNSVVMPGKEKKQVRRPIPETSKTSQIKEPPNASENRRTLAQAGAKNIPYNVNNGNTKSDLLSSDPQETIDPLSKIIEDRNFKSSTDNMQENKELDSGNNSEKDSQNPPPHIDEKIEPDENEIRERDIESLSPDQTIAAKSIQDTQNQFLDSNEDESKSENSEESSSKSATIEHASQRDTPSKSVGTSTSAHTSQSSTTEHKASRSYATHTDVSTLSGSKSQKSNSVVASSYSSDNVDKLQLISKSPEIDDAASSREVSDSHPSQVPSSSGSADNLSRPENYESRTVDSSYSLGQTPSGIKSSRVNPSIRQSSDPDALSSDKSSQEKIREPLNEEPQKTPGKDETRNRSQDDDQHLEPARLKPKVSRLQTGPASLFAERSSTKVKSRYPSGYKSPAGEDGPKSGSTSSSRRTNPVSGATRSSSKSSSSRRIFTPSTGASKDSSGVSESAPFFNTGNNYVSDSSSRPTSSFESTIGCAKSSSSESSISSSESTKSDSSSEKTNTPAQNSSSVSLKDPSIRVGLTDSSSNNNSPNNNSPNNNSSNNNSSNNNSSNNNSSNHSSSNNSSQSSQKSRVQFSEKQNSTNGEGDQTLEYLAMKGLDPPMPPSDLIQTAQGASKEYGIYKAAPKEQHPSAIAMCYDIINAISKEGEMTASSLNDFVDDIWPDVATAFEKIRVLLANDYNLQDAQDSASNVIKSDFISTKNCLYLLKQSRETLATISQIYHNHYKDIYEYADSRKCYTNGNSENEQIDDQEQLAIRNMFRTLGNKFLVLFDELIVHYCKFMALITYSDGMRSDPDFRAQEYLTDRFFYWTKRVSATLLENLRSAASYIETITGAWIKALEVSSMNPVTNEGSSKGSVPNDQFDKSERTLSLARTKINSTLEYLTEISARRAQSCVGT